jgi:hypothetical protein
MNNKIKAGILTLGAMMLPLVSFAALENFKGLITSVGDIINTIIPLMFAVALIGFFYGLIKYIFGADHDKEAAKKTMIWGVVALFVMSAVWGLVNFLGEAVGINQDEAPDVSGLIPNNN